jgi:cell division protein FtsB
MQRSSRKVKLGHRLLYGILCLEIMLTLYAFLLGSKGMPQLRTLSTQQHALQHTINTLDHDIKQLEDRIAQWLRYSFYREKIAREQLQMARTNDIVYFIQAS